MASTYPAYSGGAAAQLLEHPAHHAGDTVRHRMPRQSRGNGPLLGVTAVTAALGATGLAAGPAYAAAPLSAVTISDGASEAFTADPGLALFARIQQQADGQHAGVQHAGMRHAGVQHATAEQTARLAAAQEAEARLAAQQAAAALPVATYTLSADHSRTGWHTGLDFVARTGTPVTAITAGTVTAAGWSGAYGYRVIQTLPDGTELWYCHLDRITAASGTITPGTPIGTVGATGNTTTPHLHLEVRPTPGTPTDPLTWFHSRGLNP